MSDLHKRLLNKVRQHELALGLLLLSEDNTAPPLFLSAHPPLPQLLTLPATFTRAQLDANIVSSFLDTTHRIFPVRHVYAGFQTYYHPPSSADEPIFVCHHGAGSSSMSFAMLAQTLDRKWSHDDSTSGSTNAPEQPTKVSEGPERPTKSPGLFAFDMRCHGKSHGEPDFALETLTDDFHRVYTEFISQFTNPPSIYFVGHSLGGAVLANYLSTHENTVKGFVVLDIVEETAVKSLAAMPKFISRRPARFDSYKRAIDWHLKETRLLHNEVSAGVSVPDLFRVDSAGNLVWITDLNLTEPYWETWFVLLSSNFINGNKNTAKLLILAGHEHLDTQLIIGQMQGKYQLIVFNNTPDAGHFIHEDIPHHIAASLVDFVRRNESPEEYMKKELGIVPKWGGKIHQ